MVSFASTITFLYTPCYHIFLCKMKFKMEIEAVNFSLLCRRTVFLIFRIEMKNVFLYMPNLSYSFFTSITCMP